MDVGETARKRNPEIPRKSGPANLRANPHFLKRFIVWILAFSSKVQQ